MQQHRGSNQGSCDESDNTGRSHGKPACQGVSASDDALHCSGPPAARLPPVPWLVLPRPSPSPRWARTGCSRCGRQEGRVVARSLLIMGRLLAFGPFASTYPGVFNDRARVHTLLRTRAANRGKPLTQGPPAHTLLDGWSPHARSARGAPNGASPAKCRMPVNHGHSWNREFVQ